MLTNASTKPRYVMINPVAPMRQLTPMLFGECVIDGLLLINTRDLCAPTWDHDEDYFLKKLKKYYPPYIHFKNMQEYVDMVMARMPELRLSMGGYSNIKIDKINLLTWVRAFSLNFLTAIKSMIISLNAHYNDLITTDDNLLWSEIANNLLVEITNNMKDHHRDPIVTVTNKRMLAWVYLPMIEGIFALLSYYLFIIYPDSVMVPHGAASDSDFSMEGMFEMFTRQVRPNDVSFRNMLQFSANLQVLLVNMFKPFRGINYNKIFPTVNGDDAIPYNEYVKYGVFYYDFEKLVKELRSTYYLMIFEMIADTFHEVQMGGRIRMLPIDLQINVASYLVDDNDLKHLITCYQLSKTAWYAPI